MSDFLRGDARFRSSRMTQRRLDSTPLSMSRSLALGVAIWASLLVWLVGVLARPDAPQGGAAGSGGGSSLPPPGEVFGSARFDAYASGLSTRHGRRAAHLAPAALVSPLQAEPPPPSPWRGAVALRRGDALHWGAQVLPLTPAQIDEGLLVVGEYLFALGREQGELLVDRVGLEEGQLVHVGTHRIQANDFSASREGFARSARGALWIYLPHVLVQGADVSLPTLDGAPLISPSRIHAPAGHVEAPILHLLVRCDAEMRCAARGAIDQAARDARLAVPHAFVWISEDGAWGAQDAAPQRVLRLSLEGPPGAVEARGWPETRRDWGVEGSALWVRVRRDDGTRGELRLPLRAFDSVASRRSAAPSTRRSSSR